MDETGGRRPRRIPREVPPKLPRRIGPARLKRQRTPSIQSMDAYLILILLALFSGLCALGVWYYQTRWDPHRKHVQEYLSVSDGVVHLMDPPGEVRKMVIVDMRAKDIDPLHYRLPDAIRADWPEEVTTVVKLRWDTEVVGRYEGGGIAGRCDAEVTVVDMKTRRQIAARTFTGGPPPQWVRGRNAAGAIGDKPISQVLSFLEELPKLTRQGG